MDELKEKFGKLEDQKARPGFHTRIISYILDKKLKAPFYILFSIFSANLIFSVWNLFAWFDERETFSTVRASIEGFAPTPEFFSNLATTLRESFPGHAFVIFIFNLAFVSYTVYLVFRMKKFNQRKVDNNLK